MGWILWILFRKHYKGQIIRRRRDVRFNKISELDLEIIEVREYTLLVKIQVTGTTTIVIK